MFHLKIVGGDRLPATGPAVVVANHVSWLDPLIVPLALPRKPAILAMEELWQMPVIRSAVRAYGSLAIPIRRGTVDTASLRRALDALGSGRLLLIFPEGGISPDGTLRPFHRGAVMLSARSGAPIIPIAIAGTRDALPLGRVIPRRRTVTIRVGTPIPAPRSTRQALERANAEAQAQIRALLDSSSARSGLPPENP
jgi:1-acyl-sn-glycerol-3-phosphate acyltransferase